MADQGSFAPQLDGATSRARQAGRGEAGRLRIGFTASTCFNPAATEVLKTYRLTWPGVELILEEGRSSVLETALEQGALDAAFLRPPPRSAGRLDFVLVATEPMVAALPKGHRLEGRASLKLSDLRDEAFILYPRANGPGLSENIVAACERAGFTPKVSQQTPQLASTVNLVAAAMGGAIVPDCMRQLRPDSVRYVVLRDAGLKAEFGLAWRPGRSFKGSPSPHRYGDPCTSRNLSRFAFGGFRSALRGPVHLAEVERPLLKKLVAAGG